MRYVREGVATDANSNSYGAYFFLDEKDKEVHVDKHLMTLNVYIP